MSREESTSKQYQFLQKYLNSSRNESRNAKSKDTEKPSKSDKSKKDDDWLTKKAIEELHKDMMINKVKRKTFGSVTEPKAKTNKRFLKATLDQCLNHNKRESTKHYEKSSNKLKELDRHERLRNSKKKFGERKHEFRKPEKRKRRSSSSSDD